MCLVGRLLASFHSQFWAMRELSLIKIVNGYCGVFRVSQCVLTVGGGQDVQLATQF